MSQQVRDEILENLFPPEKLDTIDLLDRIKNEIYDSNVLKDFWVENWGNTSYPLAWFTFYQSDPPNVVFILEENDIIKEYEDEKCFREKYLSMSSLLERYSSEPVNFPYLIYFDHDEPQPDWIDKDEVLKYFPIAKSDIKKSIKNIFTDTEIDDEDLCKFKNYILDWIGGAYNDYKGFLFVPGSLKKSVPVGATIGFNEWPKDYKDVLERVYWLQVILQQILEHKFVKSSLNSATSAIMARNMSHNIGSHVMSSISMDVIKKRPEDVSVLNSYLQQRMDFIARVTTEWPEWSEPVFFFSDLLQGFFNQGLLLEYLVFDDGYPADRVKFQVIHRDKSFEWTYEKNDDQSDSNEIYKYKRKENSEDFRDFIVEIPGGPIGKQAFYGYIENAIRNAAKHNSKSENDELEIVIEIIDSEQDFYTIKVYDNLSINNEIENEDGKKSTLVKKIREIIKTDLITETGEISQGNWGIQEMKVYADFLAYPSEIEKIHAHKDEVDQYYRLWAEESEYKKISNGERDTEESFDVLSYKFALKKSCLILIVDDNHGLSDDQRKKAKRVGVRFTKFDESKSKLFEKIKAHSPQMLCFVCREGNENQNRQDFTDFIEENHNYLPARIFVASNEGDQALDKDENPLHYQVRDVLEYSSVDGWEKFVVDMFKQWVFKFTDDKKFNIVVHFQRLQNDFKGFDRWKKLRNSLTDFELGDHIKIFLYHSTKTEPAKQLSDNPEIEDYTGKWILFDNHRGLKYITENSIFYQVLGSDNNINNHTIFDQFQNVPIGLSGVLFILQLIESSCMNILIIDERVASFVSKKIENQELVLDDDKKRNLIEAGIHFVNSFQFPKISEQSDDSERCFLTKKGDLENLRGDRENIEGVIVKDSKIDKIVVDKNNTGKYANCSFDVIIIHWGWIEHLKKYHKLDEKVFLASLERFSKRVIITSGRGKTDEIPPNLPFLEFSSIQSYTMRELSKIQVGKMTYSTIAGKS